MVDGRTRVAIHEDATAAVADIPPGASIAVGGFGVQHRFPTSLIVALRDQGTSDLTIVCNSLGAADQLRAQILVENHQVSKLIASFSARPGSRSAAEEQIASGELEVELVPQGILVERMRAGAARLAGFYSPVGVGTIIGEGKEVRDFDGRDFVFESGLQVDYAFLRGYRADRLGNVQFRGGSRNFNVAFAKAAGVAIVEVDEIVEPGEISPDDVHLPGLFVDRITRGTIQPPTDISKSAQRRRGADARKTYLGKPALSRGEIAERAARLIPEGGYANLGTGMPTLVSNHASDRSVMLHAENGILGYSGIVTPEDADPDVYNAGGEFVSLLPGASYFDSVTSFEIARSGNLDMVVLGAYQVDRHGNLANWSTPSMVGGGIGGAMDLVVDENTVVAVMTHHDSKGNSKLVADTTFPLTGRTCVDYVVTDLALLCWDGEGFEVTEIAPGFTAEEVASLTDMELTFAEDLGVMRDAVAAS